MEITRGLSLMFAHHPFTKPAWVYGRKAKDGSWYLRGQLDPVREDVEEVIRREAEAEPDDNLASIIRKT